MKICFSRLQKMKHIVLFCLLTITVSGQSQKSIHISYPQIAQSAYPLHAYADSIQKGSTDSIRIAYNNDLLNVMRSLLQSPNTFDFPFDSLKTISKIKSTDGLVRLYTWLLPTDSGRKYHYFGFMQYYDSKLKTFTCVELNEVDTVPLKKQVKINHWPGAIYYKIIATRNKSKKYYTVLGWHGYNTTSTRKIIDVITFKNNLPQLGAPVFKLKSATQYRMLYEFNANSSMLLHYDDNENKIVFDHLASTGFNNDKSSYGATLIYDAFEWKKGQWQYIHDVDVRNKQAPHKNNTEKQKKRTFYMQPK